MNSQQHLRQLIKSSSEITSRIEDEDYEPLMNSILEITRSNNAIRSEENNALVLKASITRISNTTLLNILETKRNLVFEENELAESLMTLAQRTDDEPNWLNLADSALSCFRTVYLSFPVQLNANPQSETQKVREKRIKRPSTVAQTAAVAEKLSKFEGENARALESVYSNIISSYVAGGQVPMPFYKLICDPNSFTKSVHNAFQLSFLIQSNLVRVFRSPMGETLLEPVEVNTPFTSQKGGDNTVHAVITLDYDLWEATVSDYQIETSMITA